MPWQTQAKKDVVTDETLRGGGSNLRSGDLRMGKPSPSGLLPAEHIGRVEQTGRIEPSQYPLEKKTTVIPKVAASEIGIA